MHKGSRFLQTIHALRDCVVHQVEEITVITSLSCPLHHLPPTKEEVNVFARVPLSVCLSVCLLARLLKNACMDVMFVRLRG